MWIREYRQDKASIQIFNILFSSKCYRSTQFQVVVADHFQGVLESIPFTAEDGKKDIFRFPASVRLSTKSAERAGSFHRQDPTLVLAGTSVCRTVRGDRCCFGFPSGHEWSRCHRIPRPTSGRYCFLLCRWICALPARLYSLTFQERSPSKPKSEMSRSLPLPQARSPVSQRLCFPVKSLGTWGNASCHGPCGLEVKIKGSVYIL